MLSGETAIGKYPIETVEMTSKIACEAEKSFPFHAWNFKFGQDLFLNEQESIAHSPCEIADQIKASAIVTL